MERERLEYRKPTTPMPSASRRWIVAIVLGSIALALSLALPAHALLEESEWRSAKSFAMLVGTWLVCVPASGALAVSIWWRTEHPLRRNASRRAAAFAVYLFVMNLVAGPSSFVSMVYIQRGPTYAIVNASTRPITVDTAPGITSLLSRYRTLAPGASLRYRGWGPKTFCAEDGTTVTVTPRSVLQHTDVVWDGTKWVQTR